MDHNHKNQDPPAGMMPTRNERLAAYTTCPGFLIEELEFIFYPQPMTTEQSVLHYKAMQKLSVFCPDRYRMLDKVARAIIETVTNDERNSDHG